MKVLCDWNEVGSSVNSLKKAGLPLHTDPAKCWDFDNIRDLFTERVKDKASLIADLGCGPSMYGCVTLELLRSMGYVNLTGIDLHVPAYTRVASALRGYKKGKTLSPYRILKSDLTSTSFKTASVDAAILLSVIEHGVDLVKLFAELERIMKKGGVVYLSTDYWEDHKAAAKGYAASGASENSELPWRIFDKPTIKELLTIASKHGFEHGGGAVPPCKDRVVWWQGQYYTFIAINLVKRQ